MASFVSRLAFSDNTKINLEKVPDTVQGLTQRSELINEEIHSGVVQSCPHQLITPVALSNQSEHTSCNNPDNTCNILHTLKDISDKLERNPLIPAPTCATQESVINVAKQVAYWGSLLVSLHQNGEPSHSSLTSLPLTPASHQPSAIVPTSSTLPLSQTSSGHQHQQLFIRQQ